MPSINNTVKNQVEAESKTRMANKGTKNNESDSFEQKLEHTINFITRNKKGGWKTRNLMEPVLSKSSRNKSTNTNLNMDEDGNPIDLEEHEGEPKVTKRSYDSTEMR